MSARRARARSAERSGQLLRDRSRLVRSQLRGDRLPADAGGLVLGSVDGEERRGAVETRVHGGGGARGGGGAGRQPGEIGGRGGGRGGAPPRPPHPPPPPPRADGGPGARAG